MSTLPIGNEGRALNPPGAAANRRVHTRFEWKGTASLRILPNGPEVLGVLLDLSEGGCGIELGMAIPAEVGSRVFVELFVRDLTLKRKGVVRRIELIRRTEKETRAGIQFMDEGSVNAKQFQMQTKGMLTSEKKVPSADEQQTALGRLWASLGRLVG